MFDFSDVTAVVLKGYMESRPNKTYTHISPSSLGGCMRAHFLKLNGVPATTPPNYGALVNFEVGRLWEELIAKAYEQQGMLHKWFRDGIDAPWVDEELNLAGTPDIIAKDEAGELFIVDSKTVRSEWFQYTKRDIDKPGGFQRWVADNKSYVYQQVCYLLLARKNGYPDMKRAVLSFASKDDGYVGRELKITLTTDLVKMVTDRIGELNNYLQRNELPPCECEGWKTNYCDMGDPHTRKLNAKKKEVNTTCCSSSIWESFNNKGDSNDNQ
jgi:hypothetical protein